MTAGDRAVDTGGGKGKWKMTKQRTETGETEREGEKGSEQSVRVTTTMPLSAVFTWYHTTRLLTTDMAPLSGCACSSVHVYSRLQKP